MRKCQRGRAKRLPAGERKREGKNFRGSRDRLGKGKERERRKRGLDVYLKKGGRKGGKPWPFSLSGLVGEQDTEGGGGLRKFRLSPARKTGGGRTAWRRLMRLFRNNRPNQDRKGKKRKRGATARPWRFGKKGSKEGVRTGFERIWGALLKPFGSRGKGQEKERTIRLEYHLRQADQAEFQKCFGQLQKSKRPRN